MEKFFASRQKDKNEENDLMQGLVELYLNSLFRVQIPKDNNEFYKCETQKRKQTEYDDKAPEYWRLPNGKYLVKLNKKRLLRW